MCETELNAENYDATDLFERRIAPLLREVVARSVAANIPVAVLFQTSRNGTSFICRGCGDNAEQRLCIAMEAALSLVGVGEQADEEVTDA